MQNLIIKNSRIASNYHLEVSCNNRNCKKGKLVSLLCHGGIMWGKSSAIVGGQTMCLRAWRNSARKLQNWCVFIVSWHLQQSWTKMTKINATKCICWNWKEFGSFLDRFSQSAIWNLRWPRIWGIAELIKPTEIILGSGSGKIILARFKSVAWKFSPI